MKSIIEISQRQEELEPFVEFHGQKPTLHEGNEEEFFEYIENRRLLDYAKSIVKRVKELIKLNDDFVAKGNVLPKNVKIPFINGYDLLKELTGLENE